MLGTYVFATAGAWLLLRGLGLRREAALAGALAFAFSGFNLMHLTHMNAVAVLAHIPWILFAAIVLLTAGDSRRAAVACTWLVAPCSIVKYLCQASGMDVTIIMTLVIRRRYFGY